MIANHFAINASSYKAVTFGPEKIWIDFLYLGPRAALNIFVLITGYFTVTHREYPTYKLMKLWLQVFTYSISALIAAAIFTPWMLNSKQILKFVLPIIRTEGQWWFASTFFVLLLFSPFLNKLLGSLSKGSYKRLLIILGVVWVIIPTLTAQPFQLNVLLWFTTLYITGGYIRLHAGKPKRSGWFYIAMSLVVSVINFGFMFICDYLGRTSEFWADKALYFSPENRLPTVLVSVLLFVGFLNIDIGSSRFINFVASATFGVYLIHNNDFSKIVLWEAVSKYGERFRGVIYILYSLAIILIVYIGATLIELFRIYVIEKRYDGGLKKLASVINRVIEKIK